MKVTGIIVRRRSLGKNLAFADIKILEKTEDKSDLSDSSCKRPNETSTYVDTEEELPPLKILFRRHSSSWDEDALTTFPTKNSELPYGAKVELDLCEQIQPPGANADSPKYEVRRWSILVDPRMEAIESARQVIPKDEQVQEQQVNSSSDLPQSTDGILATKYFALRTDQYLKYNKQQKGPRTKLHDNDKSENLSHMQDNKPKNSLNFDQYSHGDKKEKGQRAKIFARYLIDKFGLDLMRGGVMDVAGGKGQLSIELALQAKSYCLIIDPLIRGQGDAPMLRKSTVKKLQSADSPLPVYRPIIFRLNADCLKIVEESSCIVGLHPDEATEDILDAALMYNKPAALVPCCVFACLRPDRKLKNGTIVRTYDEFISYLMEKDERIEKDTLNFVGKNEVLLFDPSKRK